MRKEYITKLEDLNTKLNPVRSQGVNALAGELLTDIDNLYRDQDISLGEDRNDIETADELRHPSSGEDLTEEDYETWKRFVEGILFLSDVEESSSAIDLLRVDLFRKRPQLYEFWIVVTILKFMQRAGYKVEMQNLQTTGSGRLVWNLKFAKARTAIARLLRTSDSSGYFLFYQLFRTGERQDDMPDIALMPSDCADDKPVWIMDPKHSERRGYSLKDYKSVATRYHATFAPRRTWI